MPSLQRTAWESIQEYGKKLVETLVIEYLAEKPIIQDLIRNPVITHVVKGVLNSLVKNASQTYEDTCIV